VLLLAACKDKKESTEETTFTTLLNAVANDQIIPRHNAFETQASQLHGSCLEFTAQPTLQNLESLKSAYQSAYVSWQEISAFRFGPALTLNAREVINTFPTNAIEIEEHISAGTLPNQEDNGGFPALDYLLFHSVDSEILASFETAHRRVYLEHITAEIQQIATDLADSWESNYKSTFVNANTSASTGGLSLLSNGLIDDYEQIKRDKIALPLGLLTLGIPLPEKAEGYYSGLSLELAQAQLDAVQDLFNNGNRYGLDDLLEERNAFHSGSNLPLAEKINLELNEGREALLSIQGTLTEAIANDPQSVEEAYHELQEVVVLFKADMISALGISITSQDNDGD
jgi:predicted lipoprotein